MACAAADADAGAALLVFLSLVVVGLLVSPMLGRGVAFSLSTEYSGKILAKRGCATFHAWERAAHVWRA